MPCDTSQGTGLSQAQPLLLPWLGGKPRGRCGEGRCHGKVPRDTSHRAMANRRILRAALKAAPVPSLAAAGAGAWLDDPG